MKTELLFFVNAVLFGVGLAMDAFSVSLANGLNEPEMSRGRMCAIAGTFCGYQIAMPLIGWLCVRTVAQTFTAVQKFIPWIALVLLLYIGGKMVLEGLRGGEEAAGSSSVSFGALMLQGIATSIDALSVGFTIADLSLGPALAESFIIGLVTFGICIGGLRLGRRVGTNLSGRATLLGGCILILIGIEIFVKGIVG